MNRDILTEIKQDFAELKELIKETHELVKDLSTAIEHWIQHFAEKGE